MRKIHWALTGIVLTAIAAATFMLLLFRLPPSRNVRENACPTLEQIQTLADLVLLRIDATDVARVQITGYTGALSVVLIAKGQLLVGTDLAKAHLDDIQPEHRQATLVLAKPRILAVRVDPQEILAQEDGLWLLVPGGSPLTALAVQRACRQAQGHLAKTVVDGSIQAQARVQAQRVVQSLFDSVGWTVAIRWSR